MECYICHKLLSGKYYVDQWDRKVCESHLNRDVTFCASCNGFTKKDIALSDGRVLCPVCMSIAIKNGDSIEPMKNSVIKSLTKVGFDDLRTEDISIEVVSAERMASIRKSPVNVQNKGLTQSNVNTSFSLLGGKKQRFQHIIYMLTHLTKIEFAGTLAHEMLHAWQVQNEIHLPPKWCEGLCNMGSFLMYNTLASSLTTIYLKALHESPDPVYGDGFREVYSRFEELDWGGLIKNIRENKF